MDFVFFFFNDTATTEIYTYWHTLSLHDALPICDSDALDRLQALADPGGSGLVLGWLPGTPNRLLLAMHHWLVDSVSCRSEEHTSELQSLMRISYAVFCLKKKTQH